MNAVIEDYQSGLSAVATARKHGIDPQTVFNNLHKRGITPRPRSTPRLVGDALDRAVALRADGWSYNRIGQELGVSGVTVAKTISG